MRDQVAASIEQEVASWSGWVSVPIRSAQDVDAVVALFRMNYERPWRGEQGATVGTEPRR